jgi:dimethylhistidine N-methyltransferase
MQAFAVVDEHQSGSFAHDVHAGLGSNDKSLPCKYFYDEAGSQLFDRITELDAYYPTRAEAAIMRSHGQQMAHAIGPDVLLVELGSGSSVKTRLLLDQLQRPAAYVPVDISAEHLERTAAGLRADYPELVVLPVAADFVRGFEIPPPPRTPARTVVYFPGSTIGNFEGEDACDLLRAVRGAVGDGGGFLLGYDLIKSRAVLERAYDDELGVTAQFNKNLLARINRELDGEFDLERFDHVARWVPERSRMEIFLRSRIEQRVRVGARRYAFSAGELIHTENSHKYDFDAIDALASEGGFSVADTWTDDERLFAVSLLIAPG